MIGTKVIIKIFNIFLRTIVFSTTAKITAINVIEYIIIEIIVQLLKIKPKSSVVIIIERFIFSLVLSNPFSYILNHFIRCKVSLSFIY